MAHCECTCGKKYSSLDKLNQHFRLELAKTSKSGKHEIKVFECDECHQVFEDKDECKSHVKFHSNTSLSPESKKYDHDAEKFNAGTAREHGENVMWNGKAFVQSKKKKSKKKARFQGYSEKGLNPQSGIKPEAYDIEHLRFPVSYEGRRVDQLLSHIALCVFLFLKENQDEKMWGSKEGPYTSTITEVQLMYVEALNSLFINENCPNKFAPGVIGKKLEDILLLNSSKFKLLKGASFGPNMVKGNIVKNTINKMEDFMRKGSRYQAIVESEKVDSWKSIHGLLEKEIQGIKFGESSRPDLNNGVFAYEGAGGAGKHAELYHLDLLKTLEGRLVGGVWIAGTKRPCATCAGAIEETIGRLRGTKLEIKSEGYERPGNLWVSQNIYLTSGAIDMVDETIETKNQFVTAAYSRGRLSLMGGFRTPSNSSCSSRSSSSSSSRESSVDAKNVFGRKDFSLKKKKKP
jgi:hypothetical protein